MSIPRSAPARSLSFAMAAAGYQASSAESEILMSSVTGQSQQPLACFACLLRSFRSALSEKCIHDLVEFHSLGKL